MQCASKENLPRLCAQNFQNEHFAHTSIWVRLVPKSMPVDSDRGFHGFLVCRQSAVQKVVDWVRTTTDALPIPPTVEWALYLCTGWMERVELFKVSSYGMSENGESIASPNTAIYRTTPSSSSCCGFVGALRRASVHQRIDVAVNEHLIKPYRAYIGPVLDLFNDMRVAGIRLSQCVSSATPCLALESWERHV